MANNCTSVTNPCPGGYPNTKCVVYTGSNLLCSGIKTNDRLDVILAKIDALLCTGGGGGGDVFIEAGDGIDIDGVGTSGNPYIISSILEANNGLTLENSFVRLGQLIGQTGNPGAPLHDTEIPMGDFYLTFNNKTGDGATTAHITLETSNTPNSHANITLEAVDEALIKYDVDNTAGFMGVEYTGSGGTLQARAGYSLSGVGGYALLTNMLGNTSYAQVEVASSPTQVWTATGDTQIGLIGSKNTGFGGITAPSDRIHIAGSTTLSAPLRFDDGVDPVSGYREGQVWRTNNHLYGRLNGQNKQLDNDHNFTPNDFIQNQFLTDQTSANYWISGNGRIDGYSQIGTAGRLTTTVLGSIGVTSATDSTVGANFSVNELHFQYSTPSNAFSTGYIRPGAAGATTIDIVASQGLVIYGPAIGFETSKTATAPAIGVGGLYPLKIIGSSVGFVGEWSYLDLVNTWPAGSNSGTTGEGVNTRMNFSANRTTGGQTIFGRLGANVIDFTNTAYKGDLVFETVDAAVNSGTPTEYMRLKYDGRLFVSSLNTNLTPPVTTGGTRTVVADSTGLLSSIETPVPGSPNVPISILNPATAANTIDNQAYKQTWSWNASTDAGLLLSTTLNGSTNSSFIEKVLEVKTSGTNNAAVNVSSAAALFENLRSGVFSTNYGIILNVGGANSNTSIYAGAIGGGTTTTAVRAVVDGAALTCRGVHASASNGVINNQAIYVDAGDVVVDSFSSQNSPERIITQIAGSGVLGYIEAGTGITLSGGVISATTAGLQGLQSVLTQDSVLSENNTVDVDGNDFTWDNAGEYTIDATTFYLRASGFGSASNGDMLVLVNNGTGELGFATPGGGGGGVTSFSAGVLTDFFTTNVATATSTPALSFTIADAASHTYWGNNTGSSAAPAYQANAAFVRVNDTNVTMTLSGNPTTALLETMTATLGWTGQLAPSRGGTGLGALGTANQLMRVNAGGTALEYFTPTFLSAAVTSINSLTAAAQTMAVSSGGTDFAISSVTSTHTFSLPSAGVGITRGLITNSSQTIDGYKTHNLGMVINESGAASDFRVESDGNTNALYVDAANNRVGVFTASPSVPFHLTGNSQLMGNVGVGTSPSAVAGVLLGGSGYTLAGLFASCSVSASVGSSPSVITIAGTIIEATSGTHPVVSGLQIAPTVVTSGLASVTDAASLYISGPTVASGANSWSILISSGNCSFGGDLYQTAGASYTVGGRDMVVRNQTTGRLEIMSPDIITVNTQSAASYTLTAADALSGYLRRTNASAQTVIVPTNASVPFAIGTVIPGIQAGAGQVTISPVSGTVTINAADSAFKTRVRYSSFTLTKVGTNEWDLQGDLTT